MTSCFPDVNVWLALSVPRHVDGGEAWNWLHTLPAVETTMIFSRHTQIGLLRLLTSRGAMGECTLTLREAWKVYDRRPGDPRVKLHAEPRGLETTFREAAFPFGGQAATKAIADCYLPAFAKQSPAALAPFDQPLYALARKSGCGCIVPGIQ